MNVYRVKTGSILPLGKQGENLARKIQFDISRWISNFGPGTVQLLHQRSGDEAPYPVAVEREGNFAVWTVTNADTAAPGTGHTELQYYVGDALAKSETWMTKVFPALGPAGETPPEPGQSWLEQVVQVGVEAKSAAASAEQSAKDAADSADAAKTAQSEAENARDRAEAATVHQPIPHAETGTWWIWDQAAGVYVDSGQKTTGPAGNPGPRGEKGDPGERGEQGPPGRDAEPYDDTEIRDGLNQLKSDFDVKLDKPATPPDAAGKVLRVLAVNDDGTFTCEWGNDGVGRLPTNPAQWPVWEAEKRTTARHRIGAFDTTDLVDIAEYTMDAETLKYVFPSLADYRLLEISFYKAYKAQTGLTGNVWFRVSNGVGWYGGPSLFISHYILDASADKSIIGVYTETNNTQQKSYTYFLTVSVVDREKSYRDSPFFTLPNAEYAAYYAECNTIIKVRGIPR